MSRQIRIAELVEAQQLLPIKSGSIELMGIPESDQPRTMYVSANIMAEVQGPFADTPEGERLGEFRAWLDNFVEGGEITVSEDSDDKPSETMLARARPVEAEFWSIRVTEPETTPGIRSIGAFSDTDEFVALTWDMRENIPPGSFDDEVRSAIDLWFDYFGYISPHKGDDLDAYLSVHLAV